MATGSKKILEERLTAFEGMKAIMEKIDRGERLSVEERKDFDARNLRITELDIDLRTAREAEDLAAKMRSEVNAPAPQLINPVEARDRAFTYFLRTGDDRELRAGATTGVPLAPGTVAPNYPASLSATTGGPTAGYLIPPGWWQRLQVALKAYGGIARDFQQLQTESGQPMQWATVNPTSVVGQLVGSGSSTTPGGGSGSAELGQVGTQDYTFGQGQLSAWTYTSGVQLVSIQLAEDSAFDIDEFIAQRVGESLGRAQAAAVISGTGSSQPLGLVTALTAYGFQSVNGSGGLVPVKEGTTGIQMGAGDANETSAYAANTVGINTLRAMIAGVDPAYRAQGAKFYMSDAQLLGIRGQTDGNGRPLVNLQDGVTPGVPGSIWGYEIVVDNDIPAVGVGGTATTGTPTAAGVGGPIFGYLPAAMVLRTVNDVTLRRLDERYADQLAIGFIGYMRFDSRSNDLRAAVTCYNENAS